LLAQDGRAGADEQSCDGFSGEGGMTLLALTKDALPTLAGWTSRHRRPARRLDDASDQDRDGYASLPVS
jgi:hypothetical protein